MSDCFTIALERRHAVPGGGRRRALRLALVDRPERAARIRAPRRVGAPLGAAGWAASGARSQTREIERIEELASSQSIRDAVVRSLDRLPADQREAVRLRIVEGLPYAEVAARLGLTRVGDADPGDAGDADPARDARRRRGGTAVSGAQPRPADPRRARRRVRGDGAWRPKPPRRRRAGIATSPRRRAPATPSRAATRTEARRRGGSAAARRSSSSSICLIGGVAFAALRGGEARASPPTPPRPCSAATATAPGASRPTATAAGSARCSCRAAVNSAVAAARHRAPGRLRAGSAIAGGRRYVFGITGAGRRGGSRPRSAKRPRRAAGGGRRPGSPAPRSPRRRGRRRISGGRRLVRLRPRVGPAARRRRPRRRW